MEIALALLVLAISSLASVLVWPRRRPNSQRHLPVASGVPPDCIATLDADRLIVDAGLAPLIAGLKRDAGATGANFDAFYLPVLRQVIELVQLMPASEAHHHSHPGGLAQHTLEASLFAVQRRRGVMLPLGATPERQNAMAHRWTYGVFVGALLHDLGKAMVDLHVRWFDGRAGTGHIWSPLAGSLVELGATYYHVGFADGRQYGAHQRLPLALLQKCVAQEALKWLSEDAALMRELQAYLAGELSEGAIADLVRQGDVESTRQNLLHGPRERFATARAVPLIERLMEALRRMAGEGVLPLNRSGAAGWVFDDSVWLVAKRTADDVRAYLGRNESDKGIPGADKNDRLFDCWQDFGAVLPNPVTGGAIWRVVIEGEGYRHELSVLRFPLKYLWPSQHERPAPMKGKITALNAVPGEDETTPEPKAKPEPPPKTKPAAEVIPMPKTHSKPCKVVVSAAERTTAVPRAATRASVSEPTAVSEPVQPAEASPVQAKAEPVKAKEGTGKAKVMPTAAPEPNDDYLEDDDDVKRAKPVAGVRAVSPALPTLPRLSGAPQPVPPTDTALRFIMWLQRGLAEGVLTYNQTGAMVHFIKDGMLLISPIIFRAFATSAGESGEADNDKTGFVIQREVLKAGWHRVGPGGMNVLRYQVVKRSGVHAAYLSGVLILSPERFVNPLPPANPHVLYAPKESDKPLAFPGEKRGAA